jgi:hypothetical protein
MSRLNRAALRRDIAAVGIDLKKLRKIAQTVIDRALQGDMAAINEIADTLDGPAPVQTERRAAR